MSDEQGAGVYRQWLQDDRVEPELRAELQRLEAEGMVDELRDRFAGDLEFGTGGLRARMGAGTNRMNVHTVRKASAGVARWICAGFADGQRRLVIGYDGRRQSAQFAEETARVAAFYGVTSYLFPAARPTPLLSFAVRHLGCSAGIMVTASHNPPEYNGYKVYGADGCQVLPDGAAVIVREMESVGDVLAVPILSKADAAQSGLLHTVGPDVEAAYRVALTVLHRDLGAGVKDQLRIVYTPLHGTGGALVPSALAAAGFANVHVVKQQANLDSEFTHVASPNPEEAKAYDLALALAHELAQTPGEAPDVLLATDPDADRVGVMARDASGQYVPLSGNDIGGLVLADYLPYLQATGTLGADATVVTTHVTSDFGEAVARSYGADTVRTLTGFKYIGEQIARYEASGSRSFVFGYEESVGYLAKPFVRDKDSVQAVLLIAQMAAAVKARGSTLPDALLDLFSKHGYYRDRLLSFTFEGQTGHVRMQKLMAALREDPLTVSGQEPLSVEDTLEGVRRYPDKTSEPLDLPQADVLKHVFVGGAWIAVRPSGTEPKLKAYLGVCEAGDRAATERLDAMEAALRTRLASYLQ